MRVAVSPANRVPSEHLPPIEQSSLLTLNRKGKVVVTDQLDAAVDEWGIPDPKKYLRQLAGTLSKNYTPPARYNVHHLVYPRRKYHEPGRDSIEYRFRESTSLMVSMPVQIHNYGHKVLPEPEMVELDVMRQWVMEDDQVNQLHKLGRTILATSRWLDDMHGSGQTTYRTAVTYAKDRRLDSSDAFYDMLDACEDGQLGLMPNKQELADLGVAEATRQLGVLASARALSYRRLSLELIEKYGLDEPPGV